MFKKHVIAMPFYDVPDVGGGGGESTDLGDIISSSIAGLDEGDFAPTGGDAIPKPEVKEPTAGDTDEAELAKLEAEIKAKNPQMRGSMNIHRHQAVLTRQRNQSEKAVKEWQAKEAAWNKAKADYDKQLGEWKQYEWAKDADITNALRAIELSETDQNRFAELLLNDPRYAAILQRKDAEAGANIPTDRPGPNQRTPDGKTQYYDHEGLQKLLDWQAAQVEKKTSAALERKFQQEMDKRFASITPIQEQFELQRAWNQALSTQRGVVAKAREQWPGFAGAEPTIKKYLIDHPKSDLNEAYLEVVVKGQQKSQAEQEAAWRAKYQKEMEMKARAGGGIKPQVGSGIERVTGNNGDKRDLGDIIREQISRAR